MQKIKERLFGIVVLLSLGIIFVPMLFPQNSKKLNLTDMEMNIPVANSSVQPIIEPDNIVVLNQLEKPAINPVLNEPDLQPVEAVEFAWEPEAVETIPEINKSEIKKQKAAIEVQSSAKASATKPKTLTTQIKKRVLAQEEADLRTAWTVQIGTFKDGKNAVNLVNKLQKDGYPAYAKQIKNEQGIFTLVLVGPNAQKTEAAVLKQTLKSKYQLQGIIIQHQPISS